MKSKRAKLIKKTFKFYRINCGFFQPYKFLIDGNFLSVAQEKNMDLKNKFDKIFNGNCFIQTTGCILKELEMLGEDFQELYLAGRKIFRVKCHKQVKDPKACLIDLVGTYNKEKYTICTQDEELKKALHTEAFNTPVVQFKNHKLLLNEPPQRELEKFKEGEEKKFLPTKNEYKKINAVKLEYLKQEKKKKNMEMKKLRNELQILPKKKAAGPNPLSVKKKKEKAGFSGRQGITNIDSIKAKENMDSELFKVKKKRIHKRKKKSVKN